jgi:hypothetical protein
MFESEKLAVAFRPSQLIDDVLLLLQLLQETFNLSSESSFTSLQSEVLCLQLGQVLAF